jgi:integrase
MASSLPERTPFSARQSASRIPAGSGTTDLLEIDTDIRTGQALLRHKDFKTTMSYTHVLNRGGLAIRSQLD